MSFRWRGFRRRGFLLGDPTDNIPILFATRNRLLPGETGGVAASDFTKLLDYPAEFEYLLTVISLLAPHDSFALRSGWVTEYDLALDRRVRSRARAQPWR